MTKRKPVKRKRLKAYFGYVIKELKGKTGWQVARNVQSKLLEKK